jgi:hypothetical protein
MMSTTTNACDRIKEILLDDPYTSFDELQSILLGEGFKITGFTVSSQRRSFIEACRFLKREGRFNLWKGKKPKPTVQKPKPAPNSKSDLRSTCSSKKRRRTKSSAGKPFPIWWNQRGSV